MGSLVGIIGDVTTYLWGGSDTDMISMTRNPDDVLKIKSDKLEDIVEAGGMGDIYEMSMKNISGVVEKVAIKAFRINQTPKDIDRRLKREARVWSRLEHAHILPFYGIADICNSKNSNTRKALISPWMKNGSVEKFLSMKGGGNKELKLKLVRQIAKGLSYLHEEGVVHGDLKGNNVLVDEEENARVTDFGRAHMVENDDCSNTLMAGAYWTAPEVLQHDTSLTENLQDGTSKPSPIPLTYESDIWSLGMTILEVFDGPQKLWGNKPNPSALIFRIAKGERPQKEHYPTVKEVPGIWEFLQPCWETECSRRPTANQLCAQLEQLQV